MVVSCLANVNPDTFIVRGGKAIWQFLKRSIQTQCDVDLNSGQKRDGSSLQIRLLTTTLILNLFLMLAYKHAKLQTESNIDINMMMLH